LPESPALALTEADPPRVAELMVMLAKALE
jgi:hypothetical protein